MQLLGTGSGDGADGTVGRGARRSRHVRVVGVAASLIGALGLAACTTQAQAGHADDADAHGAPGSTHSSSSAAPVPAVITSSLVTDTKTVNPADPVTMKIAHGTLTSVKMTRASGEKTVHGAISSDGTSWHNTEDLGYSRDYIITAHGKNAQGTPVTKTQRITTLTPHNMSQPSITDIYGTSIDNGSKYGVGMVVRVHFDEQVNEAKAEKTLKVTTSPSVTGGWYWEDDQDAFWRPEHYYPTGTKVHVTADAYGQHLGHRLYGESDQSASFSIGQKHVTIANGKTDQVKVYFADKMVRKMPTSMGRGGTSTGDGGREIRFWTYNGTYTVINHENPAVMSSASYGLPADAPGGYAPEKIPWSTKISTDGIYLHEMDSTTYAQGRYNVSHGCLNLDYSNAKWFYQHAKVGDVVKVEKAGPDKITFAQGGEWSVPWSEWVKGSALA